jgi:hypothetical protein
VIKGAGRYLSYVRRRELRMDEGLLLNRMVQILFQHPAEWFTFKRMANTVHLPGIDANLIGALVDFRDDLFATNQDCRFKLQTVVIEKISQSGIKKWAVPNRPERKSRTTVSGYSAPSDDLAATHYCHSNDGAILSDLIQGRIPEIALVTSCCWKRVCQVRGRNFNLVSEDTWEELCRFRGYIHARENPRGF